MLGMFYALLMLAVVIARLLADGLYGVRVDAWLFASMAAPLAIAIGLMLVAGLTLLPALMAMLGIAATHKTTILPEGGRVSPRLEEIQKDLVVKVLQVVELDRGGFACTLGGPGRSTLFIVAAEWRGMTESEMVPPGSGQVLAVNVEVPGAGWP